MRVKVNSLCNTHTMIGKTRYLFFKILIIYIYISQAITYIELLIIFLFVLLEPVYYYVDCRKRKMIHEEYHVQV